MKTKIKVAKARLFKVYAGHDAGQDELCFAKSHAQAAEIAQTIWHENGFDCEHFQVVELVLPECVHESRFVGLIYEPNTDGQAETLSRNPGHAK